MEKAQYAIMRFAKYKGPEIGNIEAHNERTKEKYASNPDVDTSRSKYNFHLVKPPGKYRTESERQISAAGCRTRKDSIRMIETLFTASPEFFKGKKRAEIRTFFEEALHFLEQHQSKETIISAVAYDKAVEVVTDTVRQETHKEDIRLIEETKKWVLSPERKASKKERDYAAARLDGVITKIKRVLQNALAKIQKTLMQPEVKKAGKEQIKEKARESIREKLAKGKVNADRDNRERWEREGRIAPKKKHDMEL